MTYFTVVYRDIAPGDEARLLGEHPKASAMSWSHAMHERDALRSNAIGYLDEVAALNKENAALKAGAAATDERYRFLLAAYKQAEGLNTTLKVENAALRDALRKLAIWQKECRACGEFWLADEPERHTPGCLAAPKEPT